MRIKKFVEYPALIYKSSKSNTFIANCITKKVLGYGHSEEAAISNLESVLNTMSQDFPVVVKPVYQFLPSMHYV